MSYADRDEMSGSVKALAATIAAVGMIAIVVLLAMGSGGTAPNTESAMGYAVGWALPIVLMVWVISVAIVLRKRGIWILGSLLLFAAVGVATAYSRVAIVAPAPVPTPKPEIVIPDVPDMQNVVAAQPIDS